MQEKFMKEALKEAKKAYEKQELPVGCVIVKDGKKIARGHNLKESKTDTTKHAEIIAIQKASRKLQSWRLLDCEMYVTLEPCAMCAGAIGSVFNLLEDYTFNHKVEYESGVLEEECEQILKDFFKDLRLVKQKKKEGNVINNEI